MRKVMCVCLLGVAVSGQAEVYRWVDSEGRTHYGDRAPHGRGDKARTVNVGAAPAGIDPEAEKARQQLRSIDEGRQRQRAHEAQKNVEEQNRQRELAQRCQSLQNEIRDDQNTAIFFRYDEQGRRVLWTAEERLAHREQLQNLRLAHCPELPD